jgi:hypothetical protein
LTTEHSKSFLNYIILSNYEDKIKWFSDICEAIEKYKSISEEKFNYSSLRSNCKYFFLELNKNSIKLL